MSTTIDSTKSATFNLRRKIAALALAGAAASVVVAVGEGAAYAANGGYVTCIDQSNVVGVWVNVSGGASGWAGRYGSGFQQRWSYNTQGHSYSLTVGCGGSPSNWGSSNSTPYYSTGWSNVTCFPGWSYGWGSVNAHNRCYNG